VATKQPDQAIALDFAVGPERRVSGLLTLPSDVVALYVMAHGAGAGMAHPFVATMAAALAERHVGTLRYQFPYMEAGTRRPDSPPVAHMTVRAAVAEAARRAPGLPLFAGGKSFGGRMTSQAQALDPLPGVAGLIFLGFPLHPPDKPGIERGEHLDDVAVPMLFLQGSRDEFATLNLLEPVCCRLGERATLHLVDGANHAFKVPARSGRTDAAVRGELADSLAAWIGKILRK
jgi:predicted alpha/beta-hydrolase family hydrolase